jgi:hypothetical protein
MPNPSTVDKLTLFSAVDFSAIQAHLKQNLIAEPTNEKVLRDLWEKANKVYQNIGPSTRSFVTSEDLKPIEDELKPKYEKLLSRISTYSAFSTHPTNIQYVRITKLVTPQLIINLQRANRWTNIRKNMKPDELYNLLFQPPQSSENLTCQTLNMGNANGSLLFTSYNEDMRLYHPPQHRTVPLNENDPQSINFKSICLLIGGGLPFASAYRLQIADGISRIILTNGIHRIYKLAESGAEWCPLIISDINSSELPESFIGTPKTMLINQKSNPALITDFLRKNAVIPIKYRQVLKTVRLNWNYEQYEIALK